MFQIVLVNKSVKEEKNHFNIMQIYLKVNGNQ